MIPAATIARLAGLGLTPEQTAAVAEMMAEVEAATETKAGAAIASRRAADRERKERQRHGKSRDVTGHHVTSADSADMGFPLSSFPPDPPNNYPPSDCCAAPRAREAANSHERIEAKLRDAAGATENPSPSLCDASPILGLMDAGFDLGQDILPVIRSKPNPRLKSWSYYVEAIREAKARRTAAATSPTLVIDNPQQRQRAPPNGSGRPERRNGFLALAEEDRRS